MLILHRLLVVFGAVLALLAGPLHAQAPAVPVAPGLGLPPLVAVVLPLKSSAFGRAADAVRQGIMAASRTTPEGLTIQVYPTDGSVANLLTMYQSAIQQGARGVIGPLTRAEVSALATSNLISVPTVVLNAPDSDQLPSQLFVFGLAPDNEARQVAQLAIEREFHRVFIVSSPTPLDRRLREAFGDEFQKRGGKLAGHFELTAQVPLGTLRERLAAAKADMVFYACDGDKVKQTRVVVGSDLGLFATSQILSARNEPKNNADLDGIRFVDMPWLIQPDHAAVMVYPRAGAQPMRSEFERFYALGIDAVRLAMALVNGESSIDLDGVTGKLELGESRVVRRQAMPAIIRDGVAQAVDEPPR